MNKKVAAILLSTVLGVSLLSVTAFAYTGDDTDQQETGVIVREIPAEEFFMANGCKSHVLEDGELVKEIRVPKTAKSRFEKFALRKSIDFPLVNCAVAEDADGHIHIVLGACYPSPKRMTEAEEAVSGGVTEASAQAAGDAAVSTVMILSKNEYKVEIARTLVRRTLLRLVEE